MAPLKVFSVKNNEKIDTEGKIGNNNLNAEENDSVNIVKKSFFLSFLTPKSLIFLTIVFIIIYSDIYVFLNFGIANFFHSLVAEGTLALAIVTYIQMLDARRKTNF